MTASRHRNLVERAGRKAFDRNKGLAHKKKCQEKPIFTNVKKRMRAHEASGKVTRLFLTK